MLGACLLALAASLTGLPANGQGAVAVSDPDYAISMHGRPELAQGFKHFPYVNPDAPKGGVLRLGTLGTFNSLNPFIIRGSSPESLRGHVFESLLARSAGEPFSLYGLIADRITVGEGRREVTFHLRPEARFSDGRALTSKDVVFSHRILQAKGWPYMRSHYSKVARVTAVDAHTVRFTFSDGGGAGGVDGADRELVLIIGLMPILPAHGFDEATFAQSSLKPVIGSGPYMIDEVSPGRRITYRRNPDYWGARLEVNRGRHNFDVVQVDYFRDDGSMFQAFKSGQIDLRFEEDPARWAAGYDFPAVRRGDVLLKSNPSGWPAGMMALVFNTRRTMFKDQRVRRAFIEMFHFSEINRLLYNGLFKRSTSFFARSDLASTGKPASDIELQILGRHKDAVVPTVMAGAVAFPSPPPYAPLRPSLERAYQLLVAAGYEIRGQALVNTATGRQLTFEFLAVSKAQERLMLAFQRTLTRMGIKAHIRQVDSSQYWSRLKNFDFDMIQWRWSASLSPGNEQINRWTSRAADIQGSLNYAGVREPAVDAAIHAMLVAVERERFEAAVRALDRVLLSGDYVIPLFHAETQWLAHWRHIKAPSVTPLAGTSLDTWWYDPASVAR